ncbi:DNA-binding bromodomain-containing protein [Euphorbia peplus]|nr:DNA-binding bromodomain-containing protein [Euphorbia peplus]
MKRKRRNKKVKKKETPTADTDEASVKLVNLEREDDSGADEYDDGDGDGDGDGDDNDHNNDDHNDDNDNSSNGNDGEDENEEEQCESAMEVDTPSSKGTDLPSNLPNVKPDALIDNSADKSVGCVKVKLKTPKPLESHSDTDKSSLQPGLEKLGVDFDKMEDSGNSVSEVKDGAFGTVSKKPASIKIKSSKVPGGSTVEKCSNTVIAPNEIVQQTEPRTPRQESQYNKLELDSSLSIIKKVMKMEAAEPFNVPVNPEALGIPDYFDVIDTPMDFGTVCSNLEKGDKYMNSEDVYKDVQKIWNNCFKYNNKGDYILDLMRRVKKNFMKYWTSAGLFTDQSRGSSGGEGTQGDDAGASGQGKGSQLKHKKKKGHGRRHKFDCLCAICILKRRRREREENDRLAKGGATDSKLSQDLKQEGSSLVESPGGEDSVSNMGESLDLEADAEVEGEETRSDETEKQHSSGKEKYEEPGKDEEEDDKNEMEIETQKKGKAETSENVEAANRSGEHIQQSHLALTEDGTVTQTHTQKGHMIRQQEDRTAEVQGNIHKLQESKERQQKAKMYEKFRSENPLLLNLCQTLFPNNQRSFWSGPQSLFQQQSSVDTSSIHATIETLMK